MGYPTYILHPFAGFESMQQVVEADGIYLSLADGTRIIDGASGAGVVSLGHNNKAIINALENQAKRVAYVPANHFDTEPALWLAQALNNLSGGDLTHCFFSSSGSEANESAVKLAIHYFNCVDLPSKRYVLSRNYSYHGATVYATALTGNKARRIDFNDLIPDIPKTQAPYCYRCYYEKNPHDCDLECAKDLETLIKSLGAENVAAYIMEPIIGSAAAAAVPPDRYLYRIRDICNKNNILLIFDEVMVGSGRTGKFFAYQHFATPPDILTLGKGLSSGYSPLAVTMFSHRIASSIKQATFNHGFTFGSNPLSVAAGRAAVEFMMSNNIVSQVASKDLLMQEGLKWIRESCPIVGDERGKGLFWGIEFAHKDKKPFKRDLCISKKVATTCLKNGLFIYSIGSFLDAEDGDALLLMPPLTIDDRQLEKILELLCISLCEAAKSITHA